MPKATIQGIEPQEYELKSVEGGTVTLRRMSYGQWLHRQELALNLKIDAEKGKGTSGEMAMANKKVTVFEFKNSIVGHNLEDDAGNKLDFTNEATLEILDPRIGNEIGDHIMKLHEFLSNDESVKN